MPAQLLQFLGSLLAILVLAGIAWRLRLGQPPLLDSDADVREAAGEVVHGYEPTEIARDTSGRAALLADESGRVMLLRQHGAHFAGRILAHGSTAKLYGDGADQTIQVDPGERRFGAVVLAIPDPETWIARIEGIGSTRA